MFDEFSCKELQQIISTGGQLIDVRSTVEYSQGALQGAKNIPIDTIHYELNSIDKTKPVILYCRTGKRSGMVKGLFDQLGFDQVHNIGCYQHYVGCYQEAS